MTPISLLKKYWNYNQFIGKQEAIIDDVLSGENVLAILPTGSGKSICYQIPAIINNGVCLVISPLIALMNNQVQVLKAKNINAEYLSSDKTEQELNEILQNCFNGKTKILYIAPERLQNSTFITRIANLPVSLIAVDEAHCISEWGHDFRPAYLKINEILKIFNKANILALTATATIKTKEEIIKRLDLKNVKLFKESVKRSNISYQVHQTPTIKRSIVVECSKKKESAIIFTMSRKSTYELNEILLSFGLDSEFFHARLTPDEKEEKQNHWMLSDEQIMVSTTAFGMGIDKANVRKVLHLDLPNSIEAYIQEVGRAGRDGLEAHGVLFYNKESIKTLEEKFQNQLPSKSEFERIISHLYDNFNIANGERNLSEFNIRYFYLYDQLASIRKEKIKSVLNFLHAKEIIFLKSSRGRNKIKVFKSGLKNENLNDSFREMLEVLVRKYEGITFEHKDIQEFKIARNLGVSLKRVEELLIQLNEQGLLSYKNGKYSTIRFLVPRDNQRIKTLYWKWFKEIQQRKYQKQKDLIFFVTQDKYCRQLLIEKYFNEEGGIECGKCDVCKQQNKSISIDNQLINFLKNEPKSAMQIQLKFPNVPLNQLKESIEILLDKEKIRTEGLDKFVS